MKTYPRLRVARLDDYPKIARLGLAFSLDVPDYDDWSRIWLDNPLRCDGRDFPIGWVLELPNGAIAGAMGTVRAGYVFRGEPLISAVARAWFVLDEYRGFALQLMDEYLNQPGVDLFINNAVSLPAFDAFSGFCERIPLGEWDWISYWPIKALPGDETSGDEAVEHRPLPKRASEFTIDNADRFDAGFDEFWRELVRQNPEKLLARRDARTLSWHFSSALRKTRLWIITAKRRGKLRAYCTLTRQDHAFRLPALPHDDTHGLHGMRLVDYQSIEPNVDFLPALLDAAVQRCIAEDLHVLEVLGRGVPKMRIVDECAPSRKRLENWKFFYRASRSALHETLRDPQHWDPSSYDGDASFE